MNAKEAASELNVSITTISHYIKEGILVPDNLNSWHIEGEYVIPQEQVAALKEKLNPGGLSTKEVAEYVGMGCKPYHVLNAINKGELTVKKTSLHSRIQYYVQEDEKLETFKRSFNLKKETSQRHFDPQRQIYLFQSFRHKADGDVVRLMNIDKEEGYALNSIGEKISFSTILTDFEPVNHYEAGKTNNRVGSVLFEFVKPTHIKALTYTFIEIIVQQSGVRNYTIDITDNHIRLICKPFVMKFEAGSIDHELIDHAKRSLIKGECHQRKEDFVFASTDKKINLVVDLKMYEYLEQEATDNNMSIEEWVQKKLKKY